MNRPKRRGFAMATAISFIPLATMAMVSVGMLCAADYHRTADAATGAQLRQMLLAGAVDARSHVGNIIVSPANWETSLPADLAAGGARVQTSQAIDAGGIRLTITATLGDRRADEVMHFVLDGDRWVAHSTDLNDSSP
jgi:hypothetical protein